MAGKQARFCLTLVSKCGKLEVAMKTNSGTKVHRLPEPDASEVPDNGRRGLPLSGCDCEACFGRCMVNPEVAVREGLRRSDDLSRASRDILSGIPI